MFRNWRSVISTKYIIPHKNYPKILKEPPLELPHIPKNDWVVFGNERISEKFQKQHGCDVKFDRSEHWCLARKGEHKNYHPDEIPILNKIEEFRKKSNAGSLSFDGENDILTVALRTKEHGGRVRGMDKFSTTSFFCNAIHSQDRWIGEKKSFLARREELVAALNVDSLSSNKIQHVDDIKMIAEESNHVDGEKCALSLGESCKLIIQQLGNVVAIKNLVNNFLASGLVFLRDALGHQILWPKELIDHESMVVPKKHKIPKSIERSKYAEDLKNFSNLVDKFLASDSVCSIYIPFEVGVFRGTYLARISTVELKAMKDLEPLGGISICLYFRHLYDEVKDSYMFGFVNPFYVSPAGFEKRSQRIRYLIDRLKVAGENEILFMPYNHRYHWVLVVIDISSMTFWYLDSCGNTVGSNLRKFISIVVDKYLDEVKRSRIKKNIKWRVVLSPKQRGHVECGYYVLRYVKEIINNPSILTYNFNGKKIYTQEEIDEIRMELADDVELFIS